MLFAFLSGCAGSLFTGSNSGDEFGVDADGGSTSQFRDHEELTEGVLIASPTPFRSLTMVASADPDSVVEVLAQGDPRFSTWTAVEPIELEDNNRTVVVKFDVPVTEAEVRVTNGRASFAQIKAHPTEEPIWDDEEGDGDLESARAHAGKWEIPADIHAIGQQHFITYRGATSCAGSLKSGSRILGQYLVDHFEATNYQGYNCRTIGGSSTLSVHSSGRAIDVFIPTDGGGANSADNDLGDPLGNWLVEHGQEIGISLIIWDRASWGAHRSGDKHRSYGGQHPHNDHFHIELSTTAADQNTDWFNNGGPGRPPFETGAPDYYVLGDTNADGTDDLVVRRGSSLLSETSGDTLYDARQIFGLGDDEDEYLMADFNGDGRDDPAVRRGAEVRIELDGDSEADLTLRLGLGNQEDSYLVGDFDGDGSAELGVTRAGRVFIDPDRDRASELVIDYPARPDQWLVGDFDGDGTDDLAQRFEDVVEIDLDLDGSPDLTVELPDIGDKVMAANLAGDGRDDLIVRTGAHFSIDINLDGVADTTREYGTNPDPDPELPPPSEVCWPGAQSSFDTCASLVDASEVGIEYPAPTGANERPAIGFLDVIDFGASRRLSKNFQLRELVESSDDHVVLQVHAIERLQQIRDLHGALNIDDGFVTPAAAAARGWAPHSRHTYGDAFDIRPVNASLSAVRQTCRDLGGNAGISGNHVHCDFRSDSLEPAFFGNE